MRATGTTILRTSAPRRPRHLPTGCAIRLRHDATARFRRETISKRTRSLRRRFLLGGVTALALSAIGCVAAILYAASLLPSALAYYDPDLSQMKPPWPQIVWEDHQEQLRIRGGPAVLLAIIGAIAAVRWAWLGGAFLTLAAFIVVAALVDAAPLMRHLLGVPALSIAIFTAPLALVGAAAFSIFGLRRIRARNLSEERV